MSTGKSNIGRSFCSYVSPIMGQVPGARETIKRKEALVRATREAYRIAAEFPIRHTYRHGLERSVSIDFPIEPVALSFVDIPVFFSMRYSTGAPPRIFSMIGEYEWFIKLQCFGLFMNKAI